MYVGVRMCGTGFIPRSKVYELGRPLHGIAGLSIWLYCSIVLTVLTVPDRREVKSSDPETQQLWTGPDLAWLGWWNCTGTQYKSGD